MTGRQWDLAKTVANRVRLCMSDPGPESVLGKVATAIVHTVQGVEESSERAVSALKQRLNVHLKDSEPGAEHSAASVGEASREAAAEASTKVLGKDKAGEDVAGHQAGEEAAGRVKVLPEQATAIYSLYGRSRAVEDIAERIQEGTAVAIPVEKGVVIASVDPLSEKAQELECLMTDEG